ncbi:unnamed protein product [Protopolystoma xenopodis]|uniref:Uncharacterized protein n=1 Tax=Protopolystoma xenopodis TaxID=117903 RepID=A0A3S5FGW1_9PLAT|nr:unnamed protein product [Protopolystoma xenopodis]
MSPVADRVRVNGRQATGHRVGPGRAKIPERYVSEQSLERYTETAEPALFGEAESRGVGKKSRVAAPQSSARAARSHSLQPLESGGADRPAPRDRVPSTGERQCPSPEASTAALGLPPDRELARQADVDPASIRHFYVKRLNGSLGLSIVSAKVSDSLSC